MHTSSDVDTNWDYIGDFEDIDFETQLLQEIEEIVPQMLV